MLKLLTTAAVAVLLSSPAFAVDLGADVGADVAVPGVATSVKSSSAVSSHSHSAKDADGNIVVQSQEEHSTSTQAKDSAISVDGAADMTVDDEE